MKRTGDLRWFCLLRVCWSHVVRIFSPVLARSGLVLGDVFHGPKNVCRPSSHCGSISCFILLSSICQRSMFLSNPSSHQKYHMETYIFRTCFVCKYFHFLVSNYQQNTDDLSPEHIISSEFYIEGHLFSLDLCDKFGDKSYTSRGSAICNRGLDMVRVHITFPQK